MAALIKITIDYQPKNSMARCDTFSVQNATKKSKKLFDIMGAFWRVLSIWDTFWVQNHDWLSVKKIEGRVLSFCDTWGQNHDRLSAKKLEKLLVVIPFRFNFPKKIEKVLILRSPFEGSWALMARLGLKITHQSKKLKESSWAFVAPVIKITIDYQPKN